MNLQHEFEKEMGGVSWINSDIYPDGKIYTKAYTEWLEKKVETHVVSGNIITRYFRFSGISKGKKFVQEISSIDRESAIAHFETEYPHLTWRTISEQL